MLVLYLRNTLSKTVVSAANMIDAIRLPFRKEKALYRAFRNMLGFYPRNIGLYHEALLHKSMAAREESGKAINNERLEFLGDAVLDAVVGEAVFHRFPRKREGFLTNTRSKIVQRETLGRLAVQIGLDKLVKHHERTHTHNSYLAGNAFEALVGAIYLDRGYPYCRRFMNERILGHLLDVERLAKQEVNFKSKLLEWCQKYKVELEFVLLGETRSDDGSPLFNSMVVINGKECGRGKGYSKKESHQKACKNALHRLHNDRRLHQELLHFNKPSVKCQDDGCTA